jgi:hypothetical protein
MDLFAQRICAQGTARCDPSPELKGQGSLTFARRVAPHLQGSNYGFPRCRPEFSIAQWQRLDRQREDRTHRPSWVGGTTIDGELVLSIPA